MNPIEQLILLSPRQVMKQLHLGALAVDELIESGRLGALTIGKRKKIPRQELERFIQESTLRKPPVEVEQPIDPDDEVERFMRMRRKTSLQKPGGIKSKQMNIKETNKTKRG